MTELTRDFPPPRPGRPCKYPVREIQVGESFFVPTDKQQVPVSYWRAITNFKFVTRSVTENGVKGVRVWRNG